MRAVRRAMNRIGEDLFPMYLEVQEADMLAQSEYCRDEKIKRQADVRKCYEEILRHSSVFP